MHIRISSPEGYEPAQEMVDRANKLGAETGGTGTLVRDPQAAVADADILITDTWVSMGKEAEAAERLADLAPYALTAELLAGAKPDTIVLHCLPAYRGKEITAGVLDGPQSVIWDEAENRRHAQKAILTFLAEHATPTAEQD
jgi:ornithine carbamoyltransferase